MPFRKYSGCRLIYFSIIKDIKPAARRQATPSVFSLPLFVSARRPGRSFLAISSFFSPFLPLPATATTINQKKRFKPARRYGQASERNFPSAFADKNVINERVVFGGPRKTREPRCWGYDVTELN